MIYRVASAHEEGGERVVRRSNTIEFVGDDDGRGARPAARRGPRASTAGSMPVEGTEREIPAELVLLAMGFTGPEQGTLLVEQLGVRARPARQRRARRATS